MEKILRSGTAESYDIPSTSVALRSELLIRALGIVDAIIENCNCISDAGSRIETVGLLTTIKNAISAGIDDIAVEEGYHDPATMFTAQALASLFLSFYNKGVEDTENSESCIKPSIGDVWKSHTTGKIVIRPK